MRHDSAYLHEPILEAHIKERELKLGELIRLGWRIFKNNFWVFLPAIFTCVIIAVTQDIVYRFFPGKHVSLQFFLTLIVSSLLNNLMALSIALMVDSAVKDDVLTFRKALKLAYPVWPSSIWVIFLRFIIIAGIMLLFIIPGIILVAAIISVANHFHLPSTWSNNLSGIIIIGLIIIPAIVWGVYYCFVTFTVILQGRKGKDALNYSKALVKGNWRKTFGIFFVLGLFYCIPFASFQLLYIFVHNNIFTEIILLICGSIIIFYSTVVMIALFLNLDYLKNVPEPVKEVNPLDLVPSFGKTAP